jgi:hypothetical protein
MRRLGLAFLLVSGGCLDSLGHEEIVTERNQAEGMSRIEDDRIEDKHPVLDPARTVTEKFGHCEVTLNKSAAVTKLDIVPFEPNEAPINGRLFRGRTEALAAIATISGADTIPSMEVVNGALKPFNDGLYAAVEIEAEAGKRALLAALATRVRDLLATVEPAARPALEDAAVLVGAATILAGDTPMVDGALLGRAQARAAAFEAAHALARPIGFYTWTSALARIFTRDRFLQNRDGSETEGAFVALAWVLSQDAALLADYQRVTALYAGLTNPYVSYTIDALVPAVSGAAALASAGAVVSAFGAAHPALKICGATSLAFLPASRSKEVDLFDAEFCDTGVPPGANLLDVLIQAIRSGEVDLAPASDSGWYDYQIYALETLLLPERGPESQHLLLTAGYKKKLIETFKSLLIQTRETHVKQLAGAAGGALGGEPPPPVDIYPLLPAEPFPTYYLRTARGYRFLRTFLQATVGAAFLPGTSRLVESGGRSAATLAAELDDRITLLYGLHFASADAVGMARDEGLLTEELAEIDATAAVAVARAWLAAWRADADVARDPRVIIPIFYGAEQTTYWAVVGVKVLEARAEFVPGHEPAVTPSACWTGKFVPRRYSYLVEESVEVRLPAARPPPTRDELRAICDMHAGKDAIVRALESR